LARFAERLVGAPLLAPFGIELVAVRRPPTAVGGKLRRAMRGIIGVAVAVLVVAEGHDDVPRDRAGAGNAATLRLILFAKTVPAARPPRALLGGLLGPSGAPHPHLRPIRSFN